MIYLLKAFFSIKKSHEKRSWTQGIEWWENRRIPYNFLLIILGILNLIVFSFVVNCSLDFLNILSIIIFFIIANLFYTTGWILESIISIFSQSLAPKISTISLVLGIFISIIICFSPSILSTYSWIQKGEKVSSPYCDFCDQKPKLEDLVGTYSLSAESIEKLNLPDSILSKFKFELKSDSTFQVVNFPNYNNLYSDDDFELITTQGKWNLENEYTFHWTLNLFSNQPNSKNNHSSPRSSFPDILNIKGNQKPYKIYIILGDPDSWEGITLIQNVEKISD